MALPKLLRKVSSESMRKDKKERETVRGSRPPPSSTRLDQINKANSSPNGNGTTPFPGANGNGNGNGAALPNGTAGALSTPDSVGSTPSPRRKMSLSAKGRRRLSLIFNNGGSSTNLAKDAESPGKPARNVRHGTATPSPKPSLPSMRNAGAPPNGTSHSGISTPVAASVNDNASAKHTNGAGSLPNNNQLDVNGANEALASLNITTPVASPVTSPVTPATSEFTTPRAPLMSPTIAALSASDTPRSGTGTPLSDLSTPTREARFEARIQSLYSQWGDDSDSDDDNNGYATPSEGLSEVEEGDEEDEHAAGLPNGSAEAAATNSAAPGSTSVNGDGVNTPRVPRVTRSAPAPGTKVNPLHAFKRGDPASVDQAAALGPDLDICRVGLTLFLSSKMKESEALLMENDPDNNHLYLQIGHGLIQSLKGMMTFDSEDLNAALEFTKATAVTATSLRRPTESVLSKIGGLVRSGAGAQRVRQMSPLERHAELTYAETMLIKAVLTIVAGGDWLGLIKEAFNMRTAHGIYRTLQQYLDEADKNGFDEEIDMDFRSGVLLGTGTSSLMLSLLPPKVLKIAEVFGYAGDRTVALATLMSAGGWEEGSELPLYDEHNEGVRRPICDMILLGFHLVISVLMPVAGVDIAVARKILAYNTRRYTNSIFFLYFQARLHTNECDPDLANQCLQQALDLDLEYVQLQHMCLWDYGCNYLMLNNWEGARQCYEILRQESNWSRAVYSYATAVTVMELINDKTVPEATEEHAAELVIAIPKLTKKIAGKSLPIEKFVNRKARKFLAQGNRLFLPAMELGYVFGSIGYSPRRVLLGKWIPHITAELARLEASSPERWGDGTEYWDDYVLGHFLRGVAQYIARYQPPEASENARRVFPSDPSDAELDAGAEADFRAVIEAAPHVRLDHYVLHHNHYEFGRLYAARGDVANARLQFDIVTSGKLPQPPVHGAKNHGKYSLEGALQIKTNAAIQALKEESKGRR